MNISILGVGHAGTAVAADLSLKGRGAYGTGVKQHILK